jgi:hypothetical protein
MKHLHAFGLGAVAALGLSALTLAPAAAWEPTKPVEFVVPAGTGGGADQMARLIQGIVVKHNLMKQPVRGREQVGRRRRRGLPRREECQGRPAQDRDHALQPVHDAARDGRALQLEAT